MAKTENRRVNIYINTDDALKRMEKLQQASLKLHEEIQELTPGTEQFVARTRKLDEARKRLNALEDEAKQLRAEMAGMAEGTDEYVQKAKQFDQVQRAIARTGQEVEKLEINTDELLQKNEKLRQITQEYDTLAGKVSGKVAPSIKDLTQNVRRLDRELAELPEDTDEFIRKTAELNKVKARLNEVKEKVNDTRTAWQKFKSSFGDIGNIAAGTIIGEVALAGWQAIGQFIGSAVQGAELMSDEIANIQKTTGMTREEVMALNKELGKIDTRTGGSDLREIARVGGQLGIAKDELAGFVEMTDRAVVALGDDFGGGAEEVARQLGRLKTLFAETRDMRADEAMSRIGSAINHLGSISSAQAPEIAAFTQRMGTLGPMGPGIQDTLGLAAALTGDLGLSAEIASGGLTSLFLTAGKEADAFAAQMGLTKEAFLDLLNNSPNEMLLHLAKSMQGLDNKQVTDALNRMKVGSQEAVKVMSLLANQTDFVRKQQEQAAEAMEKNTSLQDEFNIKNQNFAAEMAKARKEINGFVMAIGQALVPIITDLISAFVTVLNFLKQMPKFYEENKDVILALGIAVATLNRHLIAQKAALLASKVAVLADTAAKKASTVATNVMTAAQRTLNAAFRANPIGAVITVVGLLTSALVVLYKRSETARNIMNGFFQLFKTFGQTIAKGVVENLKGIGLLLEGIFTLDWEKVKAGFKQGLTGALDAIPVTSAMKNGKKLGKAFTEGFNSERKQNLAEWGATADKRMKQMDNAKWGAVADERMAEMAGTDPASQEAERQRIEEENRKRAAALAAAAGPVEGRGKKGGTDEDKARKAEEEYNALVEQYRQFNERLAELDEERRLRNMTEDEAELKRIRLDYQDKIAEVQTYLAKTEEAENLSNEQKAEIKRKFDEQIVALEEEKLKAIEEKQAEFEARDEEKRQELLARITEMGNTDRENELLQTEEYFNQLIAQAEKYKLDSTALEELRRQALQEINDKYDQEEVAADQKKKQELLNAQMGMLSEFSGLVSATNNLVGDQSSRMVEFQKKVGLVQMAVDTGMAISRSIAAATAAAAAGGPAAPFIVGGYIASMIGTVLAAFGKAKAMFDKADAPEPPSFFFGGKTGKADGSMGSDRYGKIAGVVHEDEYVTPKSVLESQKPIPLEMLPAQPKAADLVGILEAMRLGKGFYMGGPTSNRAAATVANSQTANAPAVRQNNEINQLMNQMMNVMGRVEILLQQPLQAQATLSYEDFTEDLTDIETIRTESQL